MRQVCASCMYPSLSSTRLPAALCVMAGSIRMASHSTTVMVTRFIRSKAVHPRFARISSAPDSSPAKAVFSPITTWRNLNPAVAELTAYFPDAAAGVPVSISEISEEADLAVLKGDLSGLKKPILRMDASKEAAVSGQPLLSLGYATGISAILARAGEDAANDIAKTTGGKPREVVDELLRRKLIRPLVTQGHIGDVLPDKIVYDAQTTAGSSGGPLINREGEVIGVTFAVVKGFGGSNFGVPIRFAQPLLKP
ncbi:MAG: hypothetical protein DMG55_05650 [Acidobacteria bacterium]|nr:MAG: hypothetical protein DMG55_05650 [Acidobacteriota bacterium]